MLQHTTEDGSVDGEEAILEGLLKVLVLERLLLGNDLVKMLASVEGDLVAAMSVVHAKERYPYV
jgi:hypothetical protein